jgi:RNase H-fold protein (predicted Holliday junction resolvase)
LSSSAPSGERQEGPEPGENSPNPALPVVLAVDPGRSKCGIAVVDAAGTVLYREVVTTSAATAVIQNLAESYYPVALVVGDGTGAQAVHASLTALEPSIPVIKVDERHTSEEARRLYLVNHPPRGLRRLIPSGLRVPDEPYDDYVAVILARRWWQSQAR